jgi:hypothetical protein
MRCHLCLYKDVLKAFYGQHLGRRALSTVWSCRVANCPEDIIRIGFICPAENGLGIVRGEIVAVTSKIDHDFTCVDMRCGLTAPSGPRQFELHIVRRTHCGQGLSRCRPGLRPLRHFCGCGTPDPHEDNPTAIAVTITNGEDEVIANWCSKDTLNGKRLRRARACG